MVIGGWGHDVYPGLGPLDGGNTLLHELDALTTRLTKIHGLHHCKYGMMQLQTHVDIKLIGVMTGFLGINFPENGLCAHQPQDYY